MGEVFVAGFRRIVGTNPELPKRAVLDIKFLVGSAFKRPNELRARFVEGEA